ncbi:SGNH/GDSL hydrolase family protein [Cytophagales bacterium LB-30]|uniref:SGNH/GDSL hydrolase family protein n=1 Tax=Shiella aurantiaca TaxID=3058365 RepID=A0ABT8F472_9BACT|nr:SGNH/GDSL hydrolase family protein [Shiella aurantiaca]MDN4165188.1 SGNH/GDSL hydrolase family protein [Shiella aurantiaca]
MSTNTPSDMPQPVASQTYLALGDSYTIGEAVDENLRWPNQLVDALNKEGYAWEAPRIIARTGWTTNELQAAIKDAELKESYDWVSLLIGVNNQYRGYPMAQYEQELQALIATALNFANGDAERVFMVSIPDYGVTPFAANSDTDKIARELDAYNAYAKALCESKGILFVNITDISREAKEDASLVASDELHPSGAMYTRWVQERILPALKEKM